MGASGSIGAQSLDILDQERDQFTLVAFSVGHRVEKIPAILHGFPSVKHICVQEEKDYVSLKERFPEVIWHHGGEGLKEIIRLSDCDMVVNALVGFAGLEPTLTALEDNKILCLANKESLVVGGRLVNDLLSQGKGKLYPIDSEHVAIAKLFSRIPKEETEGLYITASGGAFRKKSREELANVTPEEALAHPTWNMGAKITIDCATMMNKGFEVIEAKVLFDYPLEKTHIILHDESHVHSFIKAKDGSLYADVSAPDMHGPIAYALHEAKIDFELVKAKDLAGFGPFHFRDFKPERYPAPGIAVKAFELGPCHAAALNGANEEAVYAFLRGEIGFLAIEELVQLAVDNAKEVAPADYPVLKEADALAREFVNKQKRRFVHGLV